MDSNHDGVPLPEVYALSGKLMVISIVVLLTTTVLILFLHLYLRWRVLRRIASTRRRIRRRLVFAGEAHGALRPAGRGLAPDILESLPVLVFSAAAAAAAADAGGEGDGEEVVECAVCLNEFEEGEKLRSLPLCGHRFHIECIDMWFHSHATCPLCRAAVFRHESPFVPMGAARIRPSLDDLLLDPPPESPPPMPDPETEIVPAAAAASPPSIRGVDRFRDLDSLLNRSYSFGFERNLATDRMVLDASTASPWRSRYRSFWSKRWPSPFGGFAGGGSSSSSSRAARVSSFRSYRSVATKSPFFRRQGFFQLSSDPTIRLRGGAGAVVPAEPLDDEPVCADGGVLVEPVAVRGFPGPAVAGEAEVNRR